MTEKIRQVEPMLRQSGQKAAIVIMTDGESSDGDLAAAMAPLQQLPVWVVVRLCTDDDNVVSYWNSIDEKLEVEMDVIDDMLGRYTCVYINDCVCVSSIQYYTIVHIRIIIIWLTNCF